MGDVALVLVCLYCFCGVLVVVFFVLWGCLLIFVIVVFCDCLSFPFLCVIVCRFLCYISL